MAKVLLPAHDLIYVSRSLVLYLFINTGSEDAHVRYRTNMTIVAVIGAGISGLSTAYYLSRASQTKVTSIFFYDKCLCDPQLSLYIHDSDSC